MKSPVIFDRGVRPGHLGVAEAGVGAGIAEGREGVGAAHRIISDQSVQPQRVDAAADESAIGLVADPDKALRVVELTSAASVALRALERER